MKYIITIDREIVASEKFTVTADSRSGGVEKAYELAYNTIFDYSGVEPNWDTYDIEEINEV